MYCILANACLVNFLTFDEEHHIALSFSIETISHAGDETVPTGASLNVPPVVLDPDLR